MHRLCEAAPTTDGAVSLALIRLARKSFAGASVAVAVESEVVVADDRYRAGVVRAVTTSALAVIIGRVGIEARTLGGCPVRVEL